MTARWKLNREQFFLLNAIGVAILIAIWATGHSPLPLRDHPVWVVVVCATCFALVTGAVLRSRDAGLSPLLWGAPLLGIGLLGGWLVRSVGLPLDPTLLLPVVAVDVMLLVLPGKDEPKRLDL